MRGRRIGKTATAAVPPAESSSTYYTFFSRRKELVQVHYQLKETRSKLERKRAGANIDGIWQEVTQAVGHQSVRLCIAQMHLSLS